MLVMVVVKHDPLACWLYTIAGMVVASASVATVALVFQASFQASAAADLRR
jgi:hypothetical protein